MIFTQSSSLAPRTAVIPAPKPHSQSFARPGKGSVKISQKGHQRAGVLEHGPLHRPKPSRYFGLVARSRGSCLGDFAPRGNDSRSFQGSGGESFLRKESFSTGAPSLPIESDCP